MQPIYLVQLYNNPVPFTTLKSYITTLSGCTPQHNIKITAYVSLSHRLLSLVQLLKYILAAEHLPAKECG